MIDDVTVVTLTARALLLVLYLSLPPIVVAASVGVLISLLQALTQIQEQTLGFVVKLVAVIVTIFATATFLGNTVVEYTLIIFNMIGQL